MCLCYGNGLYDEAAAKVYGAVGCPPIHNNEQKMAWKNYVYAVVEHFKGRITYYEIWNEPNASSFNKNATPEQYGNIVKVARDAVKKANPNATERSFNESWKKFVKRLIVEHLKRCG